MNLWPPPRHVIARVRGGRGWSTLQNFLSPSDSEPPPSPFVPRTTFDRLNNLSQWAGDAPDMSYHTLAREEQGWPMTQSAVDLKFGFVLTNCQKKCKTLRCGFLMHLCFRHTFYMQGPMMITSTYFSLMNVLYFITFSYQCGVYDLIIHLRCTFRLQSPWRHIALNSIGKA